MAAAGGALQGGGGGGAGTPGTSSSTMVVYRNGGGDGDEEKAALHTAELKDLSGDEDPEQGGGIDLGRDLDLELDPPVEVHCESQELTFESHKDTTEKSPMDESKL